MKQPTIKQLLEKIDHLEKRVAELEGLKKPATQPLDPMKEIIDKLRRMEEQQARPPLPYLPPPQWPDRPYYDPRPYWLRGPGDFPPGTIIC